MNHWWMLITSAKCLWLLQNVTNFMESEQSLKPLREAEVEISWKALRLSESLRSGAAILLWSLSPPGQEISDMWRQRAIDFQAFSYNMLKIRLQLNFPFLRFPAHVISRLHAFAILCRCHGVPLRFVPQALEGLLFHPMQSDFTTCLTPKQLDAFLERAAPNRFTYIVRSPEWAAGTLLVFKSLQTTTFYHSACRRYTWTWKDLKRPAYGGKVTFSIGNLINLHFQNFPDSPEMENIGNFTFQDLSSSDKIDVPPMVPAPTTSKPLKPTQPPAVAPVVKDSGVCWWIGRIGRIILRCLENSWDILAWGQWIQWLVQQTLREATLQYGCSVRWLIKLVGFRPAPLKTIQIHYGVQVGKPVNPLPAPPEPEPEPNSSRSRSRSRSRSAPPVTYYSITTNRANPNPNPNGSRSRSRSRSRSPPPEPEPEPEPA